MPYRAAIESVIARCDELRARIEKLQHVPVPHEHCESIDVALAWEARLRVLVARLEAHRADADDFAPTVQDSSDEPVEQPAPPKPLHMVVAAALVLATIVVFAIQLRPSAAPARVKPPKFALMAANVVSPTHKNDRCTVRVDRGDDAACDVDIICPSVEKRFHQNTCGPAFELRAAHNYVSFTTDDGESFDIELDAWR